MAKHYFLGLAAGRKGACKQFFTHGSNKDLANLSNFLNQKYDGEEAILTKNGRSALALALKAYFKPGDAVIVNGFTCYAVYEATKAAGVTPAFADIEEATLNFDFNYLEKLCQNQPKIKGIIVQNTLGNPIDFKKLETFAAKYNLTIIEDLAHSTGAKYPDGREVGTVGAATILSFGKDKSIDTISGGALILRKPHDTKISAPVKSPKVSDTLRSRLYPTFGAMCRGLSYVHLGGALMRLLVKIHWVEKSADNRLDLNCKINKFEAKLALEQLKNINKQPKPIREFYFVNNREEVLKKLRKAGYYFDGFWYEKPVSPVRYYKKVHFPEKDCPTSVQVAAKIINLPTYYSKKDLEKARKIIKEHLWTGTK